MQNQQNTGYSPQTIINSSNVDLLQPVWHTNITSMTGTPVITNGTVYVTGTGSIVAVNESTGKIIWLDNKAKLGHTIKTRVGVTIADGDVYAGTTDNYLLSLNASTGALNWIAPVTEDIVGSAVAYLGAEATPLVYAGKVIVGETLGDDGVRGVVRAFNQTNGALLWTFYTVPPAPTNSTNQQGYLNPDGSLSWGTNGTSGCDSCGGGAVWNVPALDPRTGIIYFGTGNPYPFSSYIRSPNTTYCNLWTDSVIAVNSSNGKMVWAYQEDCDDQYDLDLGMPVQLFNETINGVQTEVVGDAGKVGYYYELNAATGAFIFRTKLGIHLNDNFTPPGFKGIIYPSANGGVNTLSTYDPSTNMIYTEANNQPGNCPKCEVNSTLYAIDAATGAIVWNLNSSIIAGGVSSTNDIVFTTGNHTLLALNGYTGAVLWNYTEPSGNSPFRWEWGPPSVTDGMVFFMTWGVHDDGELIAFSAPQTLNIVENGLPSGTLWKIDVGGVWYDGTTNTISISPLSVGSYSWVAATTVVSGAATRYVPSESKGTVIFPPELTVDIAYSTQYHVGLVAKGDGQISPMTGWYNSGSSIQIKATPASGEQFINWIVSSGAQISIGNVTSPDTTAQINGPGTITAKFG